jgi:hypothetical protein
MEGASAELAAFSTEQRLQFIRSKLAKEHKSLSNWKRNWSIFIGVTGVAQLVAAIVWEDKVDLGIIDFDKDYHVDLYAGAVRAVIGLTAINFFPKPRVDLPPPEGNDCETLAAAEKALRDSAAHIAVGRAWHKHASLVALQTGFVLTVGIGWGRWGTAIAGALLAGTVGEIIIFTQPMGAVSAYDDYKAGKLGGSTGTSWRVAPSPIGQQGFGLSAVGTF